MFDKFVKINISIIKQKEKSVKFGTYIYSLLKDKSIHLKLLQIN
jgi:hypothetical protein